MISNPSSHFRAMHIDSPVDGALVYRHGFNLMGWVVDAAQNEDMECVEAQIDGTKIGSTRRFYQRADVSANYPGANDQCGFEFLCTIPALYRRRTTAQVVVYLRRKNSSLECMGSLWVRFSEIDYRLAQHGELVVDNFIAVMRRDNMYGSGPPSPVADPSCVSLVMRYIHPGQRVLDVGCGIGAYGKELLARGVDWHGVEVIPAFHERMDAEGLPNTLIPPGPLPFGDKSFDAAIAIEVVEHIDAYESFVAEMARVVRGRACFSVPNCEAIPILSYMHALPWHMLESDHKNFFARGSLKALLERHFTYVEVFTYGNLPNIRSFDGVEIPNHLFAVADHA